MPAVEIPGAAHGLDGLFDRIHDEPCAAVIDQLGHGTMVPRDGVCAASYFANETNIIYSGQALGCPAQ